MSGVSEDTGVRATPASGPYLAYAAAPEAVSPVGATKLTAADIERVRRGGRVGPQVAETATRVAVAYCGTTAESAERRLAEEIIDIWLREAVEEVRAAMSRQLRSCPFLPRALALRMAHDVESVALPILRHSEVLTDEDLCDVIRCAGTAHLVAIAQRRRLSQGVADALIARRREPATAALIDNPGATLSERSFHRIIDSLPDAERIHTTLARRVDLPVAIAERLIAYVSDQLRESLVVRFGLPQTLAISMADLAREAATTRALAADDRAAAVAPLVDHLHSVRRLTPTFLLRALCDGKITLFEAGLAKRASLSLEHTRAMLRVADSVGEAELYQRAGISPLLYPAFRAAVEVLIRGGRLADPSSDPDRAIRRVIDRMIMQYEDIDPAELETVLTRLYQKLGGGAAQEQAAG